MTGKNRFAGRRIVVAEDSPTQAEYLRHLLVKEGYEVVLAVHGRDALEAIRRDPPALVLTDIVMPEMDGYELCREIKADQKTAGIPVILVTQSLRSRRRAQRAGVGGGQLHRQAL